MSSNTTSAQRCEALLTLTETVMENQRGNQELRAFTNYMYQSLNDFSESERDECCSKIFNIMDEYRQKKRRSRRFRQPSQPSQQQPLQPQPQPPQPAQPPMYQQQPSLHTANVHYQPHPSQWNPPPASDEVQGQGKNAVFNSAENSYMWKNYPHHMQSIGCTQDYMAPLERSASAPLPASDATDLMI